MKRCFIRGLMALAGALLLCGCGKGHWEDVEKITGYKGKARLNPFLAAERLLNELGHDAHAAKSLGKLPSHDAAIFISGEGGLPEGRAKQLLRWAYSGGHLIYFLDGTRPYNDFDTQFGAYISALLLDEQKDPVLEQLGVGVQKRFPEEEIKDLLQKSAGNQDDESEEDDEEEKSTEDESKLESEEEVAWNGKTYHLSLGGYQNMILKRKLQPGEFSAGSKNESLALHLRHGMGSVTLLAHARPFRNHWIGEDDHARWLSALVGENGSKEVLFVAATTGSFFGLLWQHGWMAVVTLVLCLGFWLWQQMPRFGPLADVELDSTRHFASHIGALGEFFWRMRRVTLLVNSARDAVWERVRERHRSLDDCSRQMNDQLAEEISRRSGLPVKRVSAAFDVSPPNSAHNFVNLMRDLQTIRRAL
ncbi:DUF4350 domain-containing protein [Prosthecobacter sp.]|uniref:DUF4350 domain-containing protein n=1 Tax=Prosthecobacter sp. TaxID=1965333 RepID=UPI002487287A|nr:DUF4350 domain-containing protein [Prosthecobacter sp.]MDI1315158.1 hypothetical protein [Prosthecobacter sp.]